jgi:pectate lyase
VFDVYVYVSGFINMPILSSAVQKRAFTFITFSAASYGIFFLATSNAISTKNSALENKSPAYTKPAKDASAIDLSTHTVLIPAGKRNDLPAFPGAEGFGALTAGGRGGKVIKVTTLADSGPGSLRAAMMTTGPRTIMFEVAGTIELKTPIIMSGPEYSFLTIAGQSAPGDGVQIKGYDVIIGEGVRDVIIRYMRFRPGFTKAEDHSKFSLMLYGETDKPSGNIIIDHCTFSWAPDDTGMWDAVNNVTWQWNIFGEAMYHDYPNPNVTPISRGMIVGAEDGRGKHQYNVSIHKNYYVNNDQRNPYLSANGPYEFINNLVYNWGSFGTQLSTRSEGIKINLIGNVYRPGPAIRTDGRYAIAFDSGNNPDSYVYVRDNIGPYRTTTSQPEWNIIGTGIVANSQDYWRVPAPQRLQRDTPWPNPRIRTSVLPSNIVANTLLDQVGATRPVRDRHDTKLVNDYRNFTGSIRNASSQTANDWPALRGATVAVDTDNDGMPSTWERQYGFNTADATDGPLDNDGDGYTNLEEYLNITNPNVRDR